LREVGVGVRDLLARKAVSDYRLATRTGALVIMSETVQMDELRASRATLEGRLLGLGKATNCREVAGAADPARVTASGRGFPVCAFSGVWPACGWSSAGSRPLRVCGKLRR